jgi:hypothetical protein
VFFKHTCPHKTWGDDPAYRSYPEEVRRAKIYGDHAGKSLDDRMFMLTIEADDPIAVQRTCEADACPGWGTLVLLVLEGPVVVATVTDLVMQLRDRPRERSAL